MSKEDQQIIAFDESGNTGSDLLDKNQPVFVLASVKFTFSQALELTQLFQTNADELKFNRLKKYHKNHSRIIAFLNHELISDETVKIALFHKEYCICVHTVDRLIEPLAHKDGLDFYKDGLNLAYTNLLFYCTAVLCDREIWEQYKIDFIKLFKQRDVDSILSFYETVQNLMKSSDKRGTDFSASLSPIFMSHEIIHDILGDWDTNNFDPMLTGFINLIDNWGRKTNTNFFAFVDYSKSLNHFRHIIDKVNNIVIKQQIVGADRRTLQLPLKLIDVKFEDSKKNPVVQIADIIAGAANHYYRALADNKFSDKLSEQIGQSKLAKLLHSPVWPSQAFTPQDLDTVHNGKANIIDSLMQLSNNANTDNL
ncbi:MAG TPA: DUF3800 domain-containing protein [Ferruginibacter sp.]|nr:DUF3800 domain-containing protein [Ferruginibacter sp.]